MITSTLMLAGLTVSVMASMGTPSSAANWVLNAVSSNVETSPASVIDSAVCATAGGGGVGGNGGGESHSNVRPSPWPFVTKWHRALTSCASLHVGAVGQKAAIRST